MDEICPRTHVVVMGVSGCGKSTVGSELARALDAEFVDADDLHPAANKQLMREGVPLSDADRWPWLERVGDRLAHADGAIVVACSALRRGYRDLLRARDPRVRFVHLSAPKEYIAERMRGRLHEFMPDTLLDSQYDALEPLGADEPHLEVDVRRSPGQIAAEVVQRLAACRPAPSSVQPG